MVYNDKLQPLAQTQGEERQKRNSEKCHFVLFMCQKQKDWLDESFSQSVFIILGSLFFVLALLLLTCEMGLKIYTTFNLEARYDLRFSVMSLKMLEVHRLQALVLIAKIL